MVTLAIEELPLVFLCVFYISYSYQENLIVGFHLCSFFPLSPYDFQAFLKFACINIFNISKLDSFILLSWNMKASSNYVSLIFNPSKCTSQIRDTIYYFQNCLLMCFVVIHFEFPYLYLYLL